jgi:DNA-binding LytR/AlgR family response regulator
MKNNILILDDELLASSYLKECIDDFKKNDDVFSSFSVHCSNKLSDFWTKINDLQPSIIFLDIEMPGQNGIEVAQKLKQNLKTLNYIEEPIIVFCTAYDNYAYQAFTVSAVDYLLKPATEEKIASVFNKIITHHKEILNELYEFVFVNVSGVDIKIPTKEILYFKADMKYISVITPKKEFLLNDTLLSLEKKHPAFIKTHRAYLINPTHIQKFFKKNNHWFVTIKNYPNPLPVSRRQKQELELKINYKTFFDENEN